VWHRSHSSASPSPAPAVRASHCRTWQCRCRAARVRGRSPLLEPLPPRCYKSRASSSSSDFFTRTELPTSPLLFSVQVTGESSLLHFFLPIGSAPSARPHPARPCRSLVQHLHRSAATHRLSLPLRAPPPLATSGELPPPPLFAKWPPAPPSCSWCRWHCPSPPAAPSRRAATTVRWRSGVVAPEVETGRGYRTGPRPSRPCGPGMASLWAENGPSVVRDF
jgi:hypothetical protein